MSKIISFIKEQLDFPSLIRRIILSWLMAVTIEYYKLPIELRDLSRLDGLAEMSLGWVIFYTVCLTVIFFSLSRVINTRKIERCGLVIAFVLIAVASLGASVSQAYLAVCLLITAALMIFCWFGWRNSDELKAPKNIYLRIIVCLSALFFLFVCAWTVGRVLCFSSPTYDFGIFSQMFYNMKESGLPMTTVERDGSLSHFAVHVSPIYYLILPFYILFPTPSTLQVLQALVVTSAVIPLWKLGKHHGLSDAQRMLVCILLLLFPAFSGGTSYDIHENCFLTPLILWLLYGIDRKNLTVTAVFGLLVLTVKEDAAVYVAVIALWLIVKSLLRFDKTDKRELLTGIFMLTVSIAWFLAVTTYLAKSGDGVMTYRYDNFMYDGSASLFTVIKSIILNPMKAVYECVDAQKLKFIALTLLPLLGLPLITRRYERYILLIPYVLINLMSDYQYQHDIFFQYTFGSTALLIYMTAVNLADIKSNLKRISTLAVAVLISAFCFYTYVLPIGLQYPTRAVQYSGYYQRIRDMLDTIPADSSVAASTFYTTHLSQREILYDVRYCSKEHLLESEYIVLDVDSEKEYSKYAENDSDNGFDDLVKLLENSGYRKYGEVDNVLVIYQK